MQVAKCTRPFPSNNSISNNDIQDDIQFHNPPRKARKTGRFSRISDTGVATGEIATDDRVGKFKLRSYNPKEEPR